MVVSNNHITIDVRPAVGVYAIYRRPSYKPWYAIAEFVDNSTQSYYDHKTELLRAYKLDGHLNYLRVEATIS